MKITTPQLATLVETLQAHYPYVGAVDVRHMLGFDPNTEEGTIDVRLYHDAEEVYTFEIDTVGRLTHYA